MTKPILKAVSKFLEKGLTADMQDRKPYIDCAKVLIDELINASTCDYSKSSEKETVELVLEPAGRPGQLKDILKEAMNPPSSTPKEKLQPPLGDYAIIVDKDKQLIKIDGLSQDSIVELDGIQYLHKDAIGKKFKTGKVIDNEN